MVVVEGGVMVVIVAEASTEVLLLTQWI